MPYFILGLAILIGLFFLIKGIRGTNPRNLQRTTAVVVAIIATTVVIFLVVTGRLGPVGWIAALFLPLLLRWRALMQAMKNMRGPTPGQNSDIETPYLRMTLEHDSGVLRGTVLQGKYRGRNLEELSPDDLLDLLRAHGVALCLVDLLYMPHPAELAEKHDLCTGAFDPCASVTK